MDEIVEKNKKSIECLEKQLLETRKDKRLLEKQLAEAECC